MLYVYVKKWLSNISPSVNIEHKVNNSSACANKTIKHWPVKKLWLNKKDKAIIPASTAIFILIVVMVH